MLLVVVVTLVIPPDGERAALAKRRAAVSPPGFEPGTKGLKVPCSTVELRALGASGGSFLTPAGDDGPVSGAIRALVSAIFSSLTGCSIGAVRAPARASG